MINERNIVLAVQKSLEFWAMSNDIQRHRKGPLSHDAMPAEAGTTPQSLTLWFCETVRRFAIDDVRPRMQNALRQYEKLPQRGVGQYGPRCARDIVQSWRELQRENRGEFQDDRLLLEVLDYVITALTNTINAIRNGDEDITRRTVGNMEVTFRRVLDEKMPSRHIPTMYPEVIDDAPKTLIRSLHHMV